MGDANIVEADIETVAGDIAQTRIGDALLALAARGLAVGKAKVAIRPEALVLKDASSGGPALAGEISKASYLGTHMEYTIATKLGALFVVDKKVAEPRQPGSEIWLEFAGAGIALVPRS